MRELKRSNKPNGHIMSKAILVSILLAVIGVMSAIYLYQYTYANKLEVELNNKQSELQTKSKDIEQKASELNLSESQKLELQRQVEELNKQKEELNKQLQAKQAEKARVASVQAAQAASVPKVVSYTTPAQTTNTSDAKAFIYQKESGNNPAAVNSIGCRGLGQACPGSKLPCSNSDYACQDAWFTNYMLQRYGSWEAAKAFWLQNHWW